MGSAHRTQAPARVVEFFGKCSCGGHRRRTPEGRIHCATCGTELLEVQAVQFVEPEGPGPQPIALVVDDMTPRGLLLLWARGVGSAVFTPYAVLRTDDDGLARLLACAPITRSVVGNTAAIAWLKDRMKLGGRIG